MRQTFTWKERTGSGLYGHTYTPHEGVACRFVKQTKLVKRPNSQEVISTAVIRCAVPVKADDLIIFDGVTYPVLSVEAITGPGGGVIEYEVRL